MKMNEDITLEEYNPLWEKYYADEHEKLCECLKNYDCHIEHIGSTSVTGMCAKPIIDILVGVKRFPPDNAFISAVETLGYEYMRDGSAPARLYFVKRTAPSYNIQVVEYGSGIWSDDIGFRDFLRSNADAAKSYSELKRKIYADGNKTLLEYSRSKSPFIDRLVAKLKR